MSREVALAHVKDALCDVLRRDTQNLTEGDRLFDDLGLDSISVIELLLAMEERAGIEVDPDELEVSIFETVGTLTDYVQSRSPAGPPDPAGPAESQPVPAPAR